MKLARARGGVGVTTLRQMSFYPCIDSADVSQRVGNPVSETRDSVWFSCSINCGQYIVFEYGDSETTGNQGQYMVFGFVFETIYCPLFLSRFSG